MVKLETTNNVLKPFVIIMALLLASNLAYGEKQNIPKRTLFSWFHRTPLASKKLGDVVSARTKSILASVQQGEIALHLGRKSLLLQMAKEPWLLSKDLPRVPTIHIGQRTLPPSLLKAKSPEQQFVILAENLEKYARTYRPDMINKSRPGRLGEFWISEIIYGIVQTFSAPAAAWAYEEPELKSGEWGAEAGKARQEASFAFEPVREPILSVSFTSEKIMQNLINTEKKDKILITQAKLLFDLKAGEVIFCYSYSIDGRGHAQVRQSFF